MLIMYTFFSKLYNKILWKVDTISRVTLSRSHVASTKPHKLLQYYQPSRSSNTFTEKVANSNLWTLKWWISWSSKYQRTAVWTLMSSLEMVNKLKLWLMKRRPDLSPRAVSNSWQFGNIQFIMTKQWFYFRL